MQLVGTAVVSIAFIAIFSRAQGSDTPVTCVISENTPVNDFIFKSNLHGPANAVYSVQENGGFVSIPFRNRGILQLTRDLRMLELGPDNTRRLQIIVMVTLPSRTSETFTITFIVLNGGFGDILFNQILPNIQNLVAEDNIFRPVSSRYPIYKKLHRILLRATVRSRAVSRAAVLFVRALKRLIIRILVSLGVHNSGTIFHLGPEGMLSVDILNNLIGATTCQNAIDATPVWPENPEYRTIDGTFNNLNDITFGAAETGFVRFVAARYFDTEGLGEPFGAGDQPNAPELPNPFQITSDFIKEQTISQESREKLLHMFMQWGQFIDHDMTLSPESEGGDDCEAVPCTGSEEDFQDPCFPILPAAGKECIRFIRSAPVCQTDSESLKPREQINVNTAFLDASMVYGSSLAVQNAVRNFTGNLGLLRVSGPQGDLLPLDTSEDLADVCNELGGCFFAGDTRVNEQASLASIHTLFVRAHNRIAIKLNILNPHWDGERIYQETRKIIGALVQKITYEDWLPLAIGRGTLTPYGGYKSVINPGISNSFATAAFRMGHSLIRTAFDVLNPSYEPIHPAIPLKQMFFNNTFIQLENVDPFLYGVLGNDSQEMDHELAIGLTQQLFISSNDVGLNLAALNIQRGRDHGLPGYGTFIKQCVEFGQHYPERARDPQTFSDLSEVITNRTLRNILGILYNNDPQNIDLWPAGLAEKEIRGTILGPTFTCLFRDQFQRMRDGDRFFYLNLDVFTLKQLISIRTATLASIMCDNVNGVVSVPKDVFNSKSRVRSCRNIPVLNLKPWKETENRCESDPCQNNGVCRIATRSGTVRCQCPNGYLGDLCETTA